MKSYKKGFTAAGKTYNFTVQSFAIDNPGIFFEINAVYIFAAQTYLGGKEDFKILYIGQTRHLGTRIREHEYDKWDCVKSKGCNSILILQVDNEKERIQIESDFIKQYNPPCNKQ